MNKKELWQVFMKTGRVSDYLNYKNARDEERPCERDELSEEFAEEFVNNFDGDFPEMQEHEETASFEEYEDIDGYDY